MEDLAVGQAPFAWVNRGDRCLVLVLGASWEEVHNSVGLGVHVGSLADGNVLDMPSNRPHCLACQVVEIHWSNDHRRRRTLDARVARPGPHARSALGPGRGADASRQRPDDAPLRRAHAAGHGRRTAGAQRAGLDDRAVAVRVVEAPRPHGGLGADTTRTRSTRRTFDLRQDHPARKVTGQEGTSEPPRMAAARCLATRWTTATSPTSPASWNGSTPGPRVTRTRRHAWNRLARAAFSARSRRERVHVNALICLPGSVRGGADAVIATYNRLEVPIWVRSNVATVITTWVATASAAIGGCSG